MSSISAKTAYMPMPASTEATSAILISATMMPSIITSSIDHISKWWAQRSISPTQCGGGVRRAASSRISMNSEVRPRRDHRAKGDEDADDRLALHPHLVGAADDRRARGPPDDRQIHQRR